MTTFVRPTIGDDVPHTDETGRVTRLAQKVPDWAYLVALPMSVVLAVPAAAVPEMSPAVWLAPISVLTAAGSAGGLALKARPRRLVKNYGGMAWQPSSDPGLVGVYEGVWVVGASRHRKGCFPAARLLYRETFDHYWNASLELDLTISPNGDLYLRALSRTPEDELDAQLMLVIS